MLYLSKGIGHIATPTDEIRVSRCGREYILNGTLAATWLAGRHKLNAARDKHQHADIAWLGKFGLVQSTAEAGPLAAYRLLTSCMICPTSRRFSVRLLNRQERIVLRWIRQAGLRLTMAELVKLHELYPKPIPPLLGTRNRQILTERIYTTETIFDNLLEHSMERSPARDATVNAVLGLLRKRRLILL